MISLNAVRYSDGTQWRNLDTDADLVGPPGRKGPSPVVPNMTAFSSTDMVNNSTSPLRASALTPNFSQSPEPRFDREFDAPPNGGIKALEDGIAIIQVSVDVVHPTATASGFVQLTDAAGKILSRQTTPIKTCPPGQDAAVATLVTMLAVAAGDVLHPEYQLSMDNKGVAYAVNLSVWAAMVD